MADVDSDDMIRASCDLKQKYEISVTNNDTDGRIDYNQVLNQVRFELIKWAEQHKQSRILFINKIWENV